MEVDSKTPPLWKVMSSLTNKVVSATADIYAGDLTQCYVDFLVQFQVRAVLVVPILQGEELWG